MIINENGYRHINKGKWEILKNQPYDYKRNGLLKHLISHRIIESKNPILQFILRYIESSFVFLMKYIDYLKCFKKITIYNR